MRVEEREERERERDSSGKAERRTWHLYRGFSALHREKNPFEYTVERKIEKGMEELVEGEDSGESSPGLSIS